MCHSSLVQGEKDVGVAVDDLHQYEVSTSSTNGRYTNLNIIRERVLSRGLCKPSGVPGDVGLTHLLRPALGRSTRLERSNSPVLVGKLDRSTVEHKWTFSITLRVLLCRTTIDMLN